MKADIYSIGTELLMGELTDSNASWIAARLPAYGIQVQGITIIGDNIGLLSEGFSRGLIRSDIIFTTGGLGPTQDDLTREAIAETFGETPTVQIEVVEDLKRHFLTRGTTMPIANTKQAQLIPSARFLYNRSGTAPGWWVESNSKIVVAMPGPPAEMKPMWEEEVAPRLRENAIGEVTVSRTIKTVGLSESAVDEAVSEFFNGEDHDFGIYSKPDGIHLRVIVQAKDTVAGQALIKPIEDSIKARLGPYIWGYDYESPEEAACDVLKRRGLTLATMESSGGGSLANSITDVHDSYKYYLCGVVACTDDMKIANGVPSKIIRRHGGVSQETATAMASAVRERFGASFGVGIAESIEPSNAVGKLGRRAYIGIVGDNRVKELELRLVPNRVVAKHRIATTALIELRRLITGTA